MFDPTESWGSIVLRWSAYAVGTAVVGYLWWAADPKSFWDSTSFIAIGIGGLIAIKATIVEPLEQRIRDLDFKIERLREELSDAIALLRWIDKKDTRGNRLS